jgi:hypothetical protein
MAFLKEKKGRRHGNKSLEVNEKRRKNIQHLVFNGMFQCLGSMEGEEKTSNVWCSRECSNA